MHAEDEWDEMQAGPPLSCLMALSLLILRFSEDGPYNRDLCTVALSSVKQSKRKHCLDRYPAHVN